MKNVEQNTEQRILEAAEVEFLEKGYTNAKMMAIAERAGVAHSMLHYYFRNKENLFRGILLQKMEGLFSSLGKSFEGEMTFEEMVRRLREIRDYFLTKEPKLAYFLLTEVVTNKRNRTLLAQVVEQGSVRSMARLHSLLKAEMDAGRIRKMKVSDFVLLLIALESASQTAIRACRESEGLGDAVADKLQEAYWEHNTQLILTAMRP